jgi:hypothetical protein
VEDDRREGKHLPEQIAHWPQVLLYLDRARYLEQLKRYHAAFAPEQVLTLIYDDFRADNEGTVRRVLRFLEVDEDAPVDVTEANPTIRMRSQKLDEMMVSVTVGRGPFGSVLNRAVRTVVPRALRRNLRGLIWRRVVFGRPEPPDEQLMRELRVRFKGEVEALSDYLGRDLVALWGYDELP